MGFIAAGDLYGETSHITHTRRFLNPSYPPACSVLLLCQLYVPLLIELPLRCDVATEKHSRRMMNFAISPVLQKSSLEEFV